MTLNVIVYLAIYHTLACKVHWEKFQWNSCIFTLQDKLIVFHKIPNYYHTKQVTCFSWLRSFAHSLPVNKWSVSCLILWITRSIKLSNVRILLSISALSVVVHSLKLMRLVSSASSKRISLKYSLKGDSLGQSSQNSVLFWSQTVNFINSLYGLLHLTASSISLTFLCIVQTQTVNEHLANQLLHTILVRGSILEEIFTSSKSRLKLE